jgi:hypothetical protein
MNEFMEAMREVFPQLLVQFEDFSTDNAFRYLDMFRHKYRCFNDDVCVYSVPDFTRFLNCFLYIDSRHWLVFFNKFLSHTIFFLTSRIGKARLSSRDSLMLPAFRRLRPEHRSLIREFCFSEQALLALVLLSSSCRFSLYLV